MLAQTSSDSDFFFLLVIAISVAVSLRMMAGSFDGARIKSYLEERGAKLLESHWEPLGKGWLGEKNDRIYEIIYLDRDGNTHKASCKTSIWSGVCFAEDTIVNPAEHLMTMVTDISLIEENKRLKAELEQIKLQQLS